MVVFWKEDSGRQLQLILPQNGRDETNFPSHDPDVPLDFVDLWHLLDRQVRADFDLNFLQLPLPAGERERVGT